MNISEIKDWLKKFGVSHYQINSDLSVDCYESVSISDMGLNNIPIKFNTINGFFDCSNNNLDSLKNSPVETTGYFNCNENNLTNLDGCPIKVGSYFVCNLNKITSLDICPEKVNGDFDCRFNRIDDIWADCDISGNYYTSVKSDDLIIDNKGKVIDYSRWRVLNKRRMVLKKIINKYENSQYKN